MAFLKAIIKNKTVIVLFYFDQYRLDSSSTKDKFYFKNLNDVFQVVSSI